MVKLEDETSALRHYLAVLDEDRAKAESKAIDQALLMDRVAVSPVGGLEPVHHVGKLSAKTISVEALRPGEVRPLGWRLPRRWRPLKASSMREDAPA